MVEERSLVRGGWRRRQPPGRGALAGVGDLGVGGVARDVGGVGEDHGAQGEVVAPLEGDVRGQEFGVPVRRPPPDPAGAFRCLDPLHGPGEPAPRDPLGGRRRLPGGVQPLQEDAAVRGRGDEDMHGSILPGLRTGLVLHMDRPGVLST